MIAYKGSCLEQTQQFVDFVYPLVTDELSPVIEDGLTVGPTEDLIKRLDDLKAKTSGINTPECNAATHAAKDALLIYMLETRTYFTTVAGRAVYGEGSVQAQLSKMYDAGWAFEIAFDDLRR